MNLEWPTDYVNKVICGDCLEVMGEMPDGCVDMTITSPPYNVGKDYGEYKDNQEYESYLSWLDKVWNELYRITKRGGRIAINIGDTQRQPYYPNHCDIASRIRKQWLLRGVIIWNKKNCTQPTAWGSWESPSNPVLRGVYESIIIACKEDFNFRKNAQRTSFRDNEFVTNTLDIWSFTPETKWRDHPAPFPIELPSRLMRLYTYVDDVVLDPFMGTGTTARVAKDLKRNFIGIEINPNYRIIAEERLAQGVL